MFLLLASTTSPKHLNLLQSYQIMLLEKLVSLTLLVSLLAFSSEALVMKQKVFQQARREYEREVSHAAIHNSLNDILSNLDEHRLPLLPIIHKNGSREMRAER